MSSVFCCANLRSHSPLPREPAHARQRFKHTSPGRRHSRQDIEAFYQEGRRLKEVEDLQDHCSIAPFQSTQDTSIDHENLTGLPSGDAHASRDRLTLGSNRGFYNAHKEGLSLMDDKGFDSDDVSTEINYQKSPILSESHALEPHDLFYTLMDTSSKSSLSTISPTRVSSARNIGTHDKAQSAVEMPGGTITIHGPTIESNTSLASRGHNRIYLDNSSSYYTSNASSRRSSIDLSVSPVPPIPVGIITSRSTGYVSPHKTTPAVQSLNVTAACLKNDFENIDERDRVTQGCGVGIGPGARKEIICVGSSATARVSQEDESKTGDYGSNIWEVGCLRRPLLTEAGKNVIPVADKQWELSNEKLDKHGKTDTHKKSPSDGFNSNDVTCWLDDQCKIGNMQPSLSSEKRPSSIFKKAFTKSMSKLRICVGANLKSTSTLPLCTISTIKNTMRDGRGEFSPLNTSSESILTDRTAIIGDYINIPTQDVTPNSEQTMANITFIPSLPTELRLDGSLEAHDELQVIEPSLVEPTTVCTSKVVAYPTEQAQITTPNLGPPANQHRFSAVYDDCVLIPYLDDRNKDDSDDDTN